MRASSRSGATSKRSARLMTRSTTLPSKPDTLVAEGERNCRKVRVEDIQKSDKRSCQIQDYIDATRRGDIVFVDIVRKSNLVTARVRLLWAQ